MVVLQTDAAQRGQFSFGNDLGLDFSAQLNEVVEPAASTKQTSRDSGLMQGGLLTSQDLLIADKSAGEQPPTSGASEKKNTVRIGGVEGLSGWVGTSVPLDKFPLLNQIITKATVYGVLNFGDLARDKVSSSAFVSVAFKDPTIALPALGALQAGRYLTGNGSVQDLVAGGAMAWLPKYQELLKQPAFAHLKHNVAPLVSGWLPIQDVKDVLNGKIDPSTVGVGMGVIFSKGETSGVDDIGKNAGVFVSFGRNKGPDGTQNQTLTIGAYSGNVRGPKDIPLVVGLSGGLSVSQPEPGARWVVKLPTGETEELPEFLAMMANAIYGKSAPMPKAGLSLDGFFERLGLGPEAVARGAAALEKAGPAASQAMDLLGTVATVGSLAGTGPFAALPALDYVLRKGRELDEAMMRKLAGDFIAQGGLSPSKLAAQLPAEMSTPELTAAANLLSKAINLHLKENPGDREKLETIWRLAANGKDTRLAYLGKAVTGDLLGAIDLATQRGDPIAHYGGGIGVLKGLATALAPDQRIEGYAGGRTPQGDYAQVAVGILPEAGVFAVLSPPGRNLPPKELFSTSLEEATEEARKLVTSDKIDTNYLQAIPGKPPLGVVASEPVASMPVDQSQLISQGYAGAVNLTDGRSYQALVSQNVQDGKFYWTGKDGKAHEIEPAAGKPAITTRQEAMDRVREMIKFGAISPANLLPLDNPSSGSGPGLRLTP